MRAGSTVLLICAILAISPLITSTTLAGDAAEGPVPRDREDGMSADNVNLSRPAPSGGVFLRNNGQLEDDEIRYYTPGGGVWFTDDGVWYDTGVIIRLEFLGSSHATPVGRGLAGHPTHFLTGRDPEGWHTDVPSHAEVWYPGLWDGIDLRYYDSGEGLKYDLILEPGADPEDIRMRYQGADSMSCPTSCELRVGTGAGDMVDSGLMIYQTRDGAKEQLPGRFTLRGGTEWGFELLEEPDPGAVVVIDPWIYGLRYSTFAGGFGEDGALGVDMDDQGYAYVAGYTASGDFPNTTGAYSDSNSGGEDIFVIKMDPQGDDLVWATYIGGGGDEAGRAVEVLDGGSALICGDTSSADFPATSGAHDEVLGGVRDGFLLELGSGGTDLAFSTFLGGGGNDVCNDLTEGSGGDIFLVGKTDSVDFPAGIGAYQTSMGGGYDGFMARFDSGGATLQFASYLGGSGDDELNGLTLDSVGKPFAVGTSASSDYPTVSGAYDTTFAGYTDVVVTMMSATLGQLMYSSFVGGNLEDAGFSIAGDHKDMVVVTGYTRSGNFPNKNSRDPSYNGERDGFALRLNPGLTGSNDLQWATFIGGVDNETGYAVALGPDENVYIAGRTMSLNFPLTHDAYQNGLNGGYDGFLNVMPLGGDTNLYSSYYGGSGEDTVRGLVVDPFKDVFAAGGSGSPDFPVTSGAYQEAPAGDSDAFVAKLAYQAVEVTAFDVSKDDAPAPMLYTRLGPYTFEVSVVDTVELDDLETVELTLDKDGEDIVVGWDRVGDSFYEVQDPDDLVELRATSASQHDGLRNWTVSFDVELDWAYAREGANDASVKVHSHMLKPNKRDLPSSYYVENDVVFAGSLSVEDGEGGEVADSTVLRGGSNLTFSGLTPVYEGAIDVYPPAGELDVMVYNDAGGAWTVSPAEGEPFLAEVLVPQVTEELGVPFHVNLSGIPEDSDGTDVEFVVVPDSSGITFSEVYPNGTQWYNSSAVESGVRITDAGPAGVDGASVMYAVSSDAGTTWGDWVAVEDVDSAEEIDASQTVELPEGTANRVKWQSSDAVGNGPYVSYPQTIYVDTIPVEFSAQFPSADQEFTTGSVEAGITVADATSGVDPAAVRYAVSNDGGATWGAWMKAEVEKGDGGFEATAELELPNGTGNLVKWRASDVAGNGPTETPAFPIIVNTWVPPPRYHTTLVSPVDGTTIPGSSVLLQWTMEKEVSGVVYDVYLDRVDPPVEMAMEGLTDTQYLAGNLVPLTKYYWMAVPRVGDETGASSSGAWSFTHDLYVEVPRVELKAPEDGAVVSELSADLQWKPLGDGSDWTYDVYLDSSSVPETLVAQGREGQNITVRDLEDGGTYHWTVVPLNEDGVYGIRSERVWSFTVDLSARPVEYGVKVGKVQDLTMKAGETRTVTFSVKNTGSDPDDFDVSVDAGELGAGVVFTNGSKALLRLRLGPGDSVDVEMIIAVPSDQPAGEYPIGYGAVSMGGSVSDGFILTLTVEGGEGGKGKDAGGGGAGVIIAAAVAAGVAVAIVVVLLVLKMKGGAKPPETDGHETPVGQPGTPTPGEPAAAPELGGNMPGGGPAGPESPPQAPAGLTKET